MKIEYIILFFFIIFIFIFSFFLSFISYILSYKNPDKEKVSIYECGFNPIHIPGEPFSIRFFLIAILFLVFDLEITYLFPWSNSTNLINLKGQVIILIFIFLLVVGLLYEWLKGGLEWE